MAEETKYSRADLLNAAASFGVRVEVMAGALALAGREMLTRKEAAQAVKNFLERRV